MSGKLRVLPLGGVGEIGKNMTVVEYEDRIVVVDCGLRFPTAEMMGIDLVLPDFTYLRENVDRIDAFIITHGHEDHLGALPWVIRDLGQDKIPVVYSGQLTIAMARSKLDEHKLRDVRLEVLPIGDVVEAGPFKLERIHLTHSIPDSSGVAITTDLGTILFTGDYKFDQTPVGGAPADMSRLAELGRAGLLLLCGDSTNVDRPGISESESLVGPHLDRVFSHCKGRIVVTCFASNIHRVQQVVQAAAANGRKVALVGRSMRKNINIGRSLGHIDIPEGMLVTPREIDQFADEKMVVISTGSQGEPLSALRRMAYRDHPQVELKRGDTVVFSATPIPGNERAVNETIDRLYHIGCEVVTPRDSPIHASGHGYAEEVKMMINLTRPKYVMPVHGDFKRMLIHGQLAEAVGVPAENIFRTENGLPLEIDENGARFGDKVQAGMIFVDGVDIGDVADVALRDRRMLSADGIFIIVATVSEQDGSSVVPPEVLARGVPFLDGNTAFIGELREAVEDSLDRAADQQITETDVLQSFLHDDLATFIYDRLKRRPMVLPVVVEVVAPRPQDRGHHDEQENPRTGDQRTRCGACRARRSSRPAGSRRRASPRRATRGTPPSAPGTRRAWPPAARSSRTPTGRRCRRRRRPTPRTRRPASAPATCRCRRSRPRRWRSGSSSSPTRLLSHRNSRLPSTMPAPQAETSRPNPALVVPRVSLA